MKRYVVGLLFNWDKTRLAMVRKNRPEWQAGLLNGIGGKIEPGELPMEAMIREFHEETGVTFLHWKPFVRLVAERDRDTGDNTEGYEIFFYKAFADTVYAVRTVTDEEIVLVGVEQVLRSPSQAVRNMRWLIPMALDPYVNGINGSFIELRDLGGN